jgi:adenosine deaminase CECR1
LRLFLWIAVLILAQPAAADWFNDIKQNGSAEDLYRTLYHMPKGGDLHNHLSGSNFSEWWYELALAEEARGYVYYTKVRIENCVAYGGNQFGRAPYYLMFRNIMAVQYEALSDCEKREYKRLQDLNEDEKKGWLNSIRLDKKFEGRDEFFQTHWPRLNALNWNPWIQAETLFLNMQAFGDEGLSYLETQVSPAGFVNPDGSAISPEQAVDILRERLQTADALATGVTVRMQVAILRFSPTAEDSLRKVYKFYPLRFLQTLRELRRQFGGVKLSIHAGEVDEPNYHVRDTLLLGADRIGHGLNLITDDETMRLMRHGPYMVEINLISNLLLQYVSDYDQHPFPEYLRTGIPVALSTDDRGMWDSTMTDEFFVAVSEFDLTWDEIKTLSRNSLQYSFVDAETKQKLLQDFESRMAKFERGMEKYGLSRVGPMPPTRQFICTRYGLCN